MASKADIIAGLIDEVAPQIAVVFSGAEPRLIGTLPEAHSAEAVKAPVDTMLLTHGLSASFISRATCRDRLFIAAHG